MNLSPSTQFPADADAAVTEPASAVPVSQPQSSEVCGHAFHFIHCYSPCQKLTHSSLKMNRMCVPKLWSDAEFMN